jgi:hypothetical protein
MRSRTRPDQLARISPSKYIFPVAPQTSNQPLIGSVPCMHILFSAYFVLFSPGRYINCILIFHGLFFLPLYQPMNDTVPPHHNYTNNSNNNCYLSLVMKNEASRHSYASSPRSSIGRLTSLIVYRHPIVLFIVFVRFSHPTPFSPSLQ